MINKFLNMVENVFVWSVVLTGIILAIILVVKAKEYFKDKKVEKKLKEKRLLGINKIKSESKKWNNEIKLSYLNNWWEEYNRIVKHNDRVDIDINPLSYIRGTVLIVWIDGEMNFFSVYIDELYDLCIYLERSMA